ncbi:MAG: hypothetical protein QM666_10990 [Acinetobacter sp.]
MSQDTKQRDRKRWVIFFIALLIPILLVSMLFVAANQDVKTKQKYEAQRAGYAEKWKQQEASEAQLSSDEQFKQLKQDDEAKVSKQNQ